MHSKLKGRSRGVTLIELVIVIVIIATLALLIVPRVIGRTEEARRAAAMTDIRTGLGMAIRMYEADTGRYPARLDDLLVNSGNLPNWHGPYLQDSARVPADPWGNPYQYRAPGEHNKNGYDLYSMGKDGKPGGEGDDADIGNW